MFGQSRSAQILLIHFMHTWQVLWRNVWMEDMMRMLSGDISLSGTGEYQCGISWLLAVPLVQAVFLGIHGAKMRVECYSASENHQTCSVDFCGTFKRLNSQVGKSPSFWWLNFCFTVAYIACSCELTPRNRYDQHTHLALFTCALMLRKTYKM